ncbi:hypothetical protein ACIQVU_19345 [Lysinibacillus sp. NPDC098008]|uniref:hypothetical protein n=1 Tax=Lysinibacillus sp. NPDC098008 TaxID=3364146 RepID=UPI003822C9D4
MYIPRYYVLSDVDFDESTFNHAYMVKTEKLLSDFSDEDSKRHFSYWDRLEYDVCSEYYIVDSGKKSFKSKAFSCKGLAERFSRLKYLHQIEEFAHEYGLLGIPYPELDSLDPKDSTINLGISGFKVEPSNLWLDEIENIKKLMKLYSILKKYRSGFLNELDETLFDYKENKRFEGHYSITWYDGVDTYVPIQYEDIENASLETIYREVLVSSIEQKIAKSVYLSSKFIDSPKTPIGFYALEIRYSQSLLTAIYYDLWSKIKQNEDIDFCANPNCNLPYEKKPRQEYCQNSCKQEAYRIRKNAERNL